MSIRWSNTPVLVRPPAGWNPPSQGVVQAAVVSAGITGRAQLVAPPVPDDLESLATAVIHLTIAGQWLHPDPQTQQVLGERVVSLCRRMKGFALFAQDPRRASVAAASIIAAHQIPEDLRETRREGLAALCNLAPGLLGPPHEALGRLWALTLARSWLVAHGRRIPRALDRCLATNAPRLWLLAGADGGLLAPSSRCPMPLGPQPLSATIRTCVGRWGLAEGVVDHHDLAADLVAGPNPVPLLSPVFRPSTWQGWRFAHQAVAYRTLGQASLRVFCDGIQGRLQLHVNEVEVLGLRSGVGEVTTRTDGDRLALGGAIGLNANALRFKIRLRPPALDFGFGGMVTRQQERITLGGPGWRGTVTPDPSWTWDLDGRHLRGTGQHRGTLNLELRSEQ